MPDYITREDLATRIRRKADEIESVQGVWGGVSSVASIRREGVSGADVKLFFSFYNGMRELALLTSLYREHFGEEEEFKRLEDEVGEYIPEWDEGIEQALLSHYNRV